MTDRPILFSAPMVRAILDGRKTQTRRVVRPQPDWDPEVRSTRLTGPFVWPVGSLGQQCGAPLTKLPYGVPGDRLWVREAWRTGAAWDNDPPRAIAPGSSVSYEATEPGGMSGKLRPGMFMPRWASRATLDVSEVRVERLRDISEEDALAEGIERIRFPEVGEWGWPQRRYRALWEQINGLHSWVANPWVFAMTFHRAA